MNIDDMTYGELKQISAMFQSAGPAKLDTGMIGLNQGMVSNAGAPFGGWKASGIGREGGNEGILEYLETKYVAINL